MKKYILRKDWVTVKAGDLLTEVNKGYLISPDKRIVFMGEEVPFALKAGMLDEYDESKDILEKFKTFTKNIAENKNRFTIKYKGLEIEVMQTKNRTGFAIQIVEQSQDWYNCTKEPFYVNGYFIYSFDYPQLQTYYIYLRGHNKVKDNNILQYSSVSKEKSKQKLYKILLTLKEAEVQIFKDAGYED